MELCFGITVLALIVMPPVLLCWTAAVGAVRYLSDRPVGLRSSYDALATGFLVVMIFCFVSFAAAVVVGSIAFVPFFFFYYDGDWPGYVSLVVTLAVLVAVAVGQWQVTRPILREEWHRLTKTDEPSRPDFLYPTE